VERALDPERIREPSRVDPRSDIYSFGAVAYFLMTARQIVDGDSPEEILLRTLQRPAPRARDAPLTAIPRELDIAPLGIDATWARRPPRGPLA